MKNLPLLCLFLFLGALLWAQEDKYPGEFRVKNRRLETSISASIAVSNDFIAYNDFFHSPFKIMKNLWGFWNWDSFPDDSGLFYKDGIEINIDDFFTKGIKFDFGTSIKPYSVFYNHKDKWGFGLDLAHIDVTGNMSLAGDLLVFYEDKETSFGVGAAAFVDVGIPFFFHANSFKVKIRPAAYVTALYTEPGITYRYISREDQTMRLEVAYDMKVYSLYDFNADDGLGKLLDTAPDIPKNNMGYDMGIGVEYPLFSWLDLGVDIKNLPVPFMASKLNDYILLEGSAFVDTSDFDVGDFLLNGGDFLDDILTVPEFEMEYKRDSAGKRLYRPFSMLFYANWRPFDRHIISFVPSLGFSVNALYPTPVAMEGGIYATLDLGNIFVTTLGINYNDRKWKNSIDFVLINFRLLEIDLGLSTQSPDFAKSWQGAGLGVNVGLKFGW